MAHPDCLQEFDTKGELECRCVGTPERFCRVATGGLPWGKLTATNIVEKPWFGKLSTDKWWLFHIVKVYSRVNISNMGYSICKMAMDQPHLAGVDRISDPLSTNQITSAGSCHLGDLLSRAMSAGPSLFEIQILR